VLAARERALRLLARREHGARELSAKLRQRGADPETAAAAVTRLAADGLQSDARFIASRLRQRLAQGYGPLWIRGELQQAGLSREAIAEALAAIDEAEWRTQAQALLARRFPRAGADRDEAARAGRWLAGRGHTAATLRAVLGRAAEDAADDPAPI
jgi:regulatory protein